MAYVCIRSLAPTGRVVMDICRIGGKASFDIASSDIASSDFATSGISSNIYVIAKIATNFHVPRHIITQAEKHHHQLADHERAAHDRCDQKIVSSMTYPLRCVTSFRIGSADH